MVCNKCFEKEQLKGFKHCEDCRNKRLNNTRRLREDKKARGICVHCKLSVINDDCLYCPKHWIKSFVQNYNIDGEFLFELLKKQKFRCYYSGKPLIPGVNASIDHVTPEVRGGGRSDIDNVVWCDRKLNNCKNERTDVEFVNLCRTIVNRVG